jgi:hypothetical protein
MMTFGKTGPQRARGAAIGTLLFWLVGAATVVGLLYVLIRDPGTPSAGTAEEIAARIAPIGRVALSAPPAPPEAETPKPETAAAEPAPGAASADAAQPAAAEMEAAGEAATAAEPAERVAAPPQAPEGEAPGEAEVSEVQEPSTEAAETTETPLGTEQPAPGDTASGRPEAAEAAPARPEVAQPEAAQPEAAQPEPAEAAPVDAEAAVQAELPEEATAEEAARAAPAAPEPAPATGQPASGDQLQWIRREDLPGKPFELRPTLPQNQ